MTKIPWTERSWNPIAGCTKVSEGCKFCYAEKMANRLAAMGQKKYQAVTGTLGYMKGWNGKIICDESALEIPLHWKKPRKIFVCSMSDLFHKDVPFGFIDKVMDVIEECPQHDFQILTKSHEIMLEYFNVLGKRYKLSCCPNLWLGVSVENQKWADIRIPILLQVPAAVRFVSFEPLLGPVDTSKFLLPQFEHIIGLYKGKAPEHIKSDWFIIGCESKGSHLGRLGEFKNEADWIQGAIDIVEQCKAAGVPIFIKQIPLNGKLCKKIAEFPAELQFQEYPK